MQQRPNVFVDLFLRAVWTDQHPEPAVPIDPEDGGGMHAVRTPCRRIRVHECQTPVAIYPEVVDGRLHFYADVPQGAPTIRALLAMIFEAVNDETPESVLAIPSDFVRQVMDKLGLGTREVGLNAMVDRLKRAARQARGDTAAGAA
jgi:hypothetical protein